MLSVSRPDAGVNLCTVSVEKSVENSTPIGPWIAWMHRFYRFAPIQGVGTILIVFRSRSATTATALNIALKINRRIAA
jgi:hypothetical protein